MWEKLDIVKQRLKEMESVVVAFSGGVDSSLLLKTAHDVLGDRAVGVMVVSPLLPAYEREEAEAVAAQIGARLDVLEKERFDDPALLANTPNRCYVCKASICKQLKAYAQQKGFRAIVDGANADDVGDYRPGQRAARECGMHSPLQDAGLTKAQIRTMAKTMDLDVWDKPASACLASRIPYGTPITEAALDQIGAAELVLRELGLRQLRVRHHGDVARIEVPPEQFDTILDHRETLVEAFKALGYAYVTLDLKGFRSGSMNEVM